MWRGKGSDFGSLWVSTGASQVVLVVKNSLANARNEGLIPGGEDPLEEEMATHSSILD